MQPRSLHPSRILLAGVLAATAATSTAVAQGAWLQLQPTNSPPARAMGGFTTMLIQNKGVLFGGEVANPGQTLNDTWEWNGTDWTQVFPTTSPQAIEGFSMSYDIIRDRVVLFSGWNGNIYIPETWEYDGSNWTQIVPTVQPPARDWSDTAFDPVRNNTVMFGGHDWQLTGGRYADTWTYDGTTWTATTPANSPSARWGHAMAFDPARNTVILFGGADAVGTASDMWEWDGTNWSQITPATVPPGRRWHQMAFDSARNAIVMTGGEDAAGALSDVWIWDGTNWTQDNPVGGPPAGLYLHGLDFDPVLGQMLHVGGSSVPGRGGSSAETWALAASSTGLAVSSAYGTGCGGASDYASYYEEFQPQTLDLGGAPGAENVLSNTFAGNGYVVLPGAPAWFTPVSPDLGLADDAVTGALPLGFTLPLPDGTTTTDVWVCSNGFIWLTSAGSNDFSPSTAEFLGQGARVAPLWTDLRPGSGGGSGTIHFDATPGAAYVTYVGIAEYGGTGGTIDMQVAFFASGNVEIRYGTETFSVAGTRSQIVGWTPGNGAADPTSTDLSAVLPIITQPDLVRADMSFSSGRPLEGSQMMVTVDGMPPGSVFGALIVSGTQVFPGIQPIAGLGNCLQYVGPFDPIYFLPAGTTFSRTLSIPSGSFTGTTLYAQAIVLAPGINAAGVASSNGLAWTIDVN